MPGAGGVSTDIYGKKCLAANGCEYTRIKANLYELCKDREARGTLQGAVKRDRIAAAGVAADFADQVVRKAALPVTILVQTLTNYRFLFDTKKAHIEEFLEYINELSLGLAKTAIKNPEQLAEDKNGKEHGLAAGPALFQNPFCNLRLLGIVVGEITDQNIGIETPHVPENPLATASFISSTETGRLRLDRTIPLSDRKSVLSGLRITRPEGSMTKSTRLPTWRRSCSRTCLGSVIWPLLVRVLVGI